MAVVQPLRPISTATPGDAGTGNVVRIVEFLGPISPELVLVDPELAPRARAVLPELAWNWTPHTRELDEPSSLRVAAVPAAMTSRWRLAAVAAAVTSRWRLAAVPAAMTFRWRLAAVPAAMTSRWTPTALWALVAVGAAAFGLGISVATADHDDFPAVESRPPVAAPARQLGGPSSAQPAPQKPGTKRPAPAPPRFVWPVETDATGYRLALYRGDRQIFEQDVTATALQLPQSWTYQGRFYGLTRGTYRWVVWPLVASGANVRQGPAIVSASYTV